MSRNRDDLRRLREASRIGASTSSQFHVKMTVASKLKKLDEELLVLFDSVDGMSHVKENLQEGIYYRYPVFKRNV